MKALTPEDLKEHNGETVTLLGRKFTFIIDRDPGGEWHIFENKNLNLMIWATLNWEMEGVPISIKTFDGDEIIAEGAYEGKVVDWDHYLRIVEMYMRGLLYGKGFNDFEGIQKDLRSVE